MEMEELVAAVKAMEVAATAVEGRAVGVTEANVAG